MCSSLSVSRTQGSEKAVCIFLHLPSFNNFFESFFFLPFPFPLPLALFFFCSHEFSSTIFAWLIADWLLKGSCSSGLGRGTLCSLACTSSTSFIHSFVSPHPGIPFYLSKLEGNCYTCYNLWSTHKHDFIMFQKQTYEVWYIMYRYSCIQAHINQVYSLHQ